MYFGRYGFVEDTKEEKKLFLERLNYLIHSLEYNDKKEYNEKEIIDVTKIVLKKYVTDSYHNLYTDALSIFLTSMGLSYFILTPEEKKEILEMDYTYDNWRIKSQELIDSFNIRIKNVFPENLRFCLEDKYFVLHIRICYHKDFKINNFIKFIRDYFILDKTLPDILKNRECQLFFDIKKRVYLIYPEVKEKYGMNRTLEKVLSFFFNDSDYNNEKTKELLDNYYKNKQKNKKDDDEYVGLKEKQD
jgi:hypothetical protein